MFCLSWHNALTARLMVLPYRIRQGKTKLICYRVDIKSTKESTEYTLTFYICYDCTSSIHWPETWQSCLYC